MGTHGPHPAAIAATSDEARTSRPELGWRMIRDVDRLVSATAEALDRSGTEAAQRLEAGLQVGYDAYARGDWELNTLFLDSDDYVWRPGDIGRDLPDGRDEYRGVEAYVEAGENFHSIWQEFEVEGVRVVEVDGPRVSAEFRWRIRAARSGVSLDHAITDELVFRDGLVVSQTGWLHAADARRR